MKRVGLALIVSCAVALAAPALAETVTLEGTVQNAKGRAAKDVDVATFWMEGDPAGGVKTDAEGAFVLEANSYGRPLTLLVMDAKRKQGALVVIQPGAVEDPIELTLEPLVRIHGTFTCEELDKRPEWTNVYLNLREGGLRVARSMSEKAEFGFHVPAGAYDLVMYGTDVRRVRRPLDVGDERKGEMNIGAIDLEATPIARLYDREMPPWTVSDAWGIESDVTLDDYRGKWVLLEFWFST